MSGEAIPKRGIERAREDAPEWATHAIVDSDGDHRYADSGPAAQTLAEERREVLAFLTGEERVVEVMSLD